MKNKIKNKNESASDSNDIVYPRRGKNFGQELPIYLRYKER